MSYSDSQARTLIIEAGLKLVEEKLIARTWGNVSARISETEFLITPSGLSYESLKPEDLALVNINDLTWSGNKKPSSEKGLHAMIYKLRPDANFVIHTHQVFASAVSVVGKDTDFAPCCGYGFPGTKKLTDKARKSLEANPLANSFLMKAHGAFCFGSDYENAFANVRGLEENSRAFFEKETENREKRKDFHAYLDDYAQIMGFWGKIPENEESETLELINEKNDAAALFCNYKNRLSLFDVSIQHFVYKKKYSKMRSAE